LKNLKKVPSEILGRVPSGKVKQVIEKVENGGRVVNPAEKQKVANGGQVEGQIVVSEIRWVGGELSTF
jgi:hypothetical protein